MLSLFLGTITSKNKKIACSVSMSELLLKTCKNGPVIMRVILALEKKLNLSLASCSFLCVMT